MATSIRDLLQAADDELARLAHYGNSASAAAGVYAAVGAAARPLGRLAQAGLGGTGRRDVLVDALASACRVHAGDPPGPGTGRAAELVGVAGDVIGRSCRNLDVEDRWAVALRLSATVRRATSAWHACGPELPVPSIDRIRRVTVPIARLGSLAPPAADRVPRWDRPVPRSFLPVGTPVPTVAVESAAQLAAWLHHANQHPSDGPLAVHELRAVCLAAGAAAGYADALLTRLTDPGLVRGDGAAVAWLSARKQLAVIADGRPVTRGYSVPLLAAAARLHDTLRREFCPPAQPRQVARLEPRQLLALSQVTRQLPTLAGELTYALRGLDGHAVARASRLPQREARVTQWLRREPVLVGCADLAGVDAALRAAGYRSALLAARLHGLTRQPAPGVELAPAATVITR